jgi:hypothetical protein
MQAQPVGPVVRGRTLRWQERLPLTTPLLSCREPVLALLTFVCICRRNLHVQLCGRTLCRDVCLCFMLFATLHPLCPCFTFDFKIQI